LVAALTAELPRLEHRPTSHARALTTKRAIEWCGLNAREEVSLRRVDALETTTHHVAGTFHCGRYLCPQCGPFAARRRLEALAEIAPAVSVIPGARHFHCVLTVRHRMGVLWSDLRACVMEAWRELRESMPFRRGVRGFIRAAETTFSGNGHHLHLHCVLTLEAGTDPDALRDAIRARWDSSVRTARVIDRPDGTVRALPGRTCDFEAQERAARADGRRGWWSEITGADVNDTIGYIVAKVLRTEVLASNVKRGARPWDLPARAFLEVWYASKGFRWFATGGCWKVKRAAVLETEDGADDVRERTGETVGTIPRSDWQSVPREGREWIVGFVSSPDVLPSDVLRAWRAFSDVARGYALTKAKGTSTVRATDKPPEGDAS